MRLPTGTAESYGCLLVPTRSLRCLRGKATPASGPAGWGPDISRRSPVPGLWGILTGALDERKQVGGTLAAGQKRSNTKKILESGGRLDCLAFHALVGSPGGQVFELLAQAAGPLDGGPLDAVTSAHAEGDRQL